MYLCELLLEFIFPDASTNRFFKQINKGILSIKLEQIASSIWGPAEANLLQKTFLFGEIEVSIQKKSVLRRLLLILKKC